MTYDWLAAVAFVAMLIVVTIVGKKIVFSIPVFAEMRRLNHEVDDTKMQKESFRAAVKVNNKSGLYTNLVFYVAILPFCVTFAARPWWQFLFEVVAVLAIFDFMYYLTHRFLFHDGALRKVHALHHQARKPTFIDSLYVHPLETFIGLSLFLISIPMVGLIVGGPLNVFSALIATLLFTQWNTINHTYTKLPDDRWLFRVVDTITGVHHAHHIDMNHGNYATMTMFYDKLFGTYEEPVKRETA